jgi:Mrp family chromosome partitioning ATPase
MTKYSKIPHPDSATVEPIESSLLERVVRNHDLVRLSPPPIPAELFKPARKGPARYRREQDVAAEEVQAAPAPAPNPVHAAAPVAVPEPQPEVVVPEVIAVPANALVAAVKPVTFKGPKHPVDRQHLKELGLIVPEGSVTALLEEFRIVKRQLLATAMQLRSTALGMAAQRVLVCSPHPGEGKTYTSVNLALSIAAEKESEVLLVDADFAKPSVLSALGLPGGPGLMDALANPDVDVADCVIGTDVPGLWVLPAGNATSSDSEFITSARTATVLDRLTQGAPHRFVIFDSPPALAASPAAELAKYVGQALIVVRADRTSHSALEDAISLLSGCPNIQLLLNAVNYNPTGRKFGSYYGYGR